MAAATVYKTSYGFRITGGTDSVSVSAYPVFVKRLSFYAVAADDSATIQNSVGTEIYKIPGATAKTLYTHDIGGESGARFDGITMSGLTNANDILYIFVR